MHMEYDDGNGEIAQVILKGQIVSSRINIRAIFNSQNRLLIVILRTESSTFPVVKHSSSLRIQDVDITGCM